MGFWKDQLGVIRDTTQKIPNAFDQPSFFTRQDAWEDYRKLSDIKGTERKYYNAIKLQLIAATGGKI